METKHTKGEWKIDTESDGNLWIVSDDVSFVIANICSGELPNGKFEQTPEETANAKLIAAAPLMLTALIGVKKGFLEIGMNDMAANIDIIIKKATE